MQLFDNYEQELARTAKGFLLQIAVWAGLVTAGLIFGGHGDKVPGYLVGVTVSLTYCLLICYRVKKSAALPPKEAVAYMRMGWLIRLSFIVLILVWSLKVPAINFLAAVAGLLSLQIVIFFHGTYIVAKRFLTK